MVKLVNWPLEPILAVAVGRQPAGNSSSAVTPGLAVNAKVGSVE